MLGFLVFFAFITVIAFIISIGVNVYDGKMDEDGFWIHFWAGIFITFLYIVLGFTVASITTDGCDEPTKETKELISSP